VRLAASGEQTNAEVKCLDGAANPYLDEEIVAATRFRY
jgi:hypothetical protein